MAADLLQISDRDRVALTRLTASRQTPRGRSIRASIVLACAEVSAAAAARRCGVTVATATKWKRRYADAGLAGLSDAPRAGRPATSDVQALQVLTAVLTEPPAGGWTTRSIADATGLSQSTVSRIRRDRFAASGLDAVPELPVQRAVLGYVYVDRGRRLLVCHHSPASADRHRRSPSTTREVADTVETLLCAGLITEPDRLPSEPTPTVDLLRRATRNVPPHWWVTVIADADPDASAKAWLRRRQHTRLVVVPADAWLAQLHVLADGLDARQLPDLLGLQRRIRGWCERRDGPFEWWRITDTTHSPPVAGVRAGRRPSDSALVIDALRDAITAGSLRAGRRIQPRVIGAAAKLPPGVVSDVLRHLADDGVIDQDAAGSFVVPRCTQHDVVETYTGRGLLGTALVRRLASRREPMPASVDDVYARLLRFADDRRQAEVESLDLDMQDELARAAEMPRIEAMFLRLSLQVRLFITLVDLGYQYPIDGIVADNTLILDTIRSGDPDAAVAAWRTKIDNCVRYMLLHVRDAPDDGGAPRRD